MTLGELIEALRAAPRSGTMRNGIAYPLPPLALITSEIGSGLWPTPNTGDAKQSGNVENWQRRAKAHAANGVNLQMPLPIAVKLWPTPTASRWSGLQSHGRNAILGLMNPRWEEWLMGFPVGWCDLNLERSATL